MILGISLVVEELHKGQRLVFRYPEYVPTAVLELQALDPLLFQALLKLHRDFQSNSPDNFARLFKKKKSNTNSQILEVTIDDLRYTSHPVSCADLSDSLDGNSSDRITQFNVVVASIRESALRRILSRSTVHDMPITSAIHPIQKQALHQLLRVFSYALLHEERKCSYVSRQVQVMTQEGWEGIVTEEALTPTGLSSSSFRDRSASLITNRDRSTSVMSTSSAGESIAVALDAMSPSPSPGIPGATPSTDAYTCPSSTAVSVCLAAMEAKLQVSSLANEVRQIYHALVEKHGITMTINTIEGGISVDVDLSCLSSLSSLSSTSIPTNKPPLSVFPHQAILLLFDDFSSILGDIHYPLKESLLRVADPRLSIEEISNVLEESVDELCNVAHILHSHHTIDIIDPILLSSIYYITPTTDLKASSTVSIAFIQYFSIYFNIKPMDFIIICNLFNGKNTLENVISTLPVHMVEYAVDLCVWLLRWHVITELKQYIIKSDLLLQDLSITTTRQLKEGEYALVKLFTEQGEDMLPAKRVCWLTGLSLSDLNALVSETESFMVAFL